MRLYGKKLHRVGGHSYHLVIPKWWIEANGRFVTLSVDKNKIVVRPNAHRRLMRR